MSKAKLRAEAINRFVTDAKAVGVWSSLKAATILTGWDTLAGALTPLVGSAPTNNGFVAADYDRGGQGLKGNGSSKYLDSNRNNNADGQNDFHMVVYETQGTAESKPLMGCGILSNESGVSNFGRLTSSVWYSRSRHGPGYAQHSYPSGAAGLAGSNRSTSTDFISRAFGIDTVAVRASQSPFSDSITVFGLANLSLYTSNTLSWYSIGSSVDLSALDTLVTRLMADLRAIEEDGMDRDALAYIRAVEAQDGSFMVTGVKHAVDRLVKGLKYDRDANGRSAWDAIGASCLLCGPRTIAGALVPLKGVAPTAYNFVSANYNQETGLVGVPAAGTYINTNRANNADGQDDHHLATYISTSPTVSSSMLAAGRTASPDSLTSVGSTGSATIFYDMSRGEYVATSQAVGFNAVARADASGFEYRRVGTTTAATGKPSYPTGSLNYSVFGRLAPTPQAYTDARLAFYSVGASLSLSALDARITKYVADVAAAIP